MRLANLDEQLLAPEMVEQVIKSSSARVNWLRTSGPTSTWHLVRGRRHINRSVCKDVEDLLKGGRERGRTTRVRDTGAEGPPVVQPPEEQVRVLQP